MSSESWGEYLVSLIFLIIAAVLFFSGSSGIFKRKLHWWDTSEGSIGAEGKFKGGSAVVLGCIFVILSMSGLVAAIYFLSNLEWYPFSWVVFLRLFVLGLLMVGIIAYKIPIFRRNILTEKETKRKPHHQSKILAKVNNWIATHSKRYECPCCGYITLEHKPPGSYDICPVCFWEDDPVQYDDHDYEGGANDMSLNQARANYRSFGAKDKERLRYVRKPLDSEIPHRHIKKLTD